MEVEVDFIDTVFVTVAVNVYVTDVCIENAGKTYFDGSREVDGMIANADPTGEIKLHEYCRNWVEADPSQLAVNAFVATERVEDRGCTSICGPSILTEGTTIFRTTTLLMLRPQ